MDSLYIAVFAVDVTQSLMLDSWSGTCHNGQGVRRDGKEGVAEKM